MKKFFSLVLALVMALSLTTVAWGAAIEVDNYADFKTRVEAGDDVKLTASIEGGGIVIDKSVVIDFNGFTLTFTGVGVGSGSITSNGFQILESAGSVTLKNGTLKVADSAKGNYYILVQNYADLTVTNMVLDGTNLDKYSGTDGDSYALSVNNGTTVINGGTAIIANDDGDLAYAFDTYDKAGYAGIPTVTVDDAVIDGNVEATGGELVIEDGTFNGEIVADSTNAALITVEGGTFASALPTGAVLASGTELVSDGAGGFIAAAAATGSTAATKFYVSNNAATDDWQLLGSFAGVKPADFLEEADYDETIPQGNLEHYVVDGGLYLAATKATGAYKLVCGNVEVYLNAAAWDEVYYEAEADVFTDVTTDEDACGKVLVTKKNLSKTYYKVTLEPTKGVEEDYYLVKVTSGGDTTLLVNGKIVEADFVNTFIEHEWAGNDVDATTKAYTTVKCENCGRVAKLYANADAAGKKAEYLTNLGWITAADAGYDVVVPVTPSTDKVTSAETFDAGIAMYVGMSVLAATGSAVVIGKKKD